MAFRQSEAKRTRIEELPVRDSEPKIRPFKKSIRKTITYVALALTLSSAGACSNLGSGSVNQTNSPGSYIVPTTSITTTSSTTTTTSVSSNVAYSTLGFYPGDGVHWVNFQNEEGNYHRPIAWALLYSDASTPSTMLGSVSWDINGYSSLPPFGTTKGRPLNVVESIPLAFNNLSLAQVAAGAADAQFLQTAQAIARSFPNAVIRLGWDFDGPWNSWAEAKDPTAFIQAFERVSKIFKGVSPGFQIMLCGDAGFQGNWTNISSLLPYFDIIGFSVYDNNSQSNLAGNLNWLQNYAASINKKIGIPEWGLLTADDTTYITTMYKWFNSLGSSLEFNIYFDGQKSQLSNYPKSQFIFNASFNTP